MSWLLTNLKATAFRLDANTLPASGTLVVDVITQNIQTAANHGVLNITEVVAIKNNFVAVTNPLTTNDSLQGYTAGSLWYNTVKKILWNLVDPTVSNAVWIEDLAVATGTAGTTGIFVTPIPLLNFKNNDGTPLAAAASAGKFGMTITLATAQFLLAEAAQANTKTDIALVEFVLPPTYVPATNFTITTNSHYTGPGTVGAAHTTGLNVYKNAAAGTQGADINATAAISIGAAAADQAFTITGATLIPGDRVTVVLTMIVQETGGASALTGRVNSVRVS
jgi:hypothetical protein